jgi:hypothetical protein
VSPTSRESHPKESVACPEAASSRSLEGRQLLPQRQVFQDQFPMAAERQRECADDHDEQLQHGGSWLELALNSTPDEFWRASIPSIAFPVGYDDKGQPINVQLMGRAWDDGKLVSMAYAFELVANAAGHGHVEATTAPPLPRERRRRD